MIIDPVKDSVLWDTSYPPNSVFKKPDPLLPQSKIQHLKKILYTPEKISVYRRIVNRIGGLFD